MSSSAGDAAVHVAYLGPEASFSHQAALELFGSTSSSAPTLHPLPSFTSIFAALQKAPAGSSGGQSAPQQYDYAVLPIENSTNGSVVQVLDLLAQCGLDGSEAPYPDLHVCAEYYLPVHHCLFVHHSAQERAGEERGVMAEKKRKDGVALPDITTLYTHPQVWGQCARFLAATFPPAKVERIDVGSTSAAATLVARAGSGKTDAAAGAAAPFPAAISSRLAGQRHGLLCLAENIEDAPGENTTRFLVLRNTRHAPRDPAYHAAVTSRLWRTVPGPSGVVDGAASSSPVVTSPGSRRGRRHKSLITFTIPHTKPGSLADALAVFKTHGFNLTSIDTRPGRRRTWQYVFFVECAEADHGPGDEQGRQEEGAGQDDDEELGAHMQRILGDLGQFTERLRYLGRFVDQLQIEP